MDENKNGWYEQSATSDWYVVSEKSAGVSAPAAQKKTKAPRKKRTGLKITLIIILVLMLIVGSVFIFAEGVNNLRDFTLSIQGLYEDMEDEADFPDEFDEFDEFFPGFDETFPDFEEEFEIIIPEDDNQIVIPSIPAESAPPESFRDYFENYYTSEETIESSNIERAEAKGDFEITLKSNSGKKLLTLEELYKNCSPSVVGVLVQFENKMSYGWGSGVILSSDGYVVTNAHVLSNAVKCTVILHNGKECEAMLVGEDAQTDLAVLKINSKGLVPANFGNNEELKIGESVAAIGNPLGMEFTNTLTNGIVSAIDRTVDYLGTSMPLIQTNTAMNEGSSGGALFNMYGQVVGITNLKMTNNYGVTIEGIGFAIPATTVKKVCDQIIANGKVLGRPGIGITCGTVPEEAMELYGLPEGLYITDVSEESDAKTKGIRPGDVITHINGIHVYTTQDVLDIRDQHKIGDFLHFTVYRDGETFEVDVEIYDLGNIY